MIGKGTALFSSGQRSVWSRPAKNPFGILGVDVDAPVRARFSKCIVPVRPMNGDTALNISAPGHCRGGIACRLIASGHILGDNLPMGQQRASRRGIFIAHEAGRRVINQSSGDATIIDFVTVLVAGQGLMIQVQ